MFYKLIIFDFDGTLADSLQWFAGSINSVADKYKFKKIDVADLETLRGQDARSLLKLHGVPGWKIPIIVNHMRLLMARSISRITLFRGIDDVLRRLSANGAMLAVVSSNLRGNVLQALGRNTSCLIRYYECGVSLSGKLSKIKKILRKTGCKPEETLLIGDEIRDGEAAKNAHVAFGAVSWGYNSLEALGKQSPALVFSTAPEIAEKLGGGA